MKKQFLSVLAFTAILLSSCGGTAKIEKASACGLLRQPPLPRPNQEK